MLGFSIRVKSTKNYLRVDKFENTNTPKRITEEVFPTKVLNSTTKFVAEQVKKKIDNNLRKGLKYTGGAVAKLKESTIKRKGHSRVFFETGKLFNATEVKKSGTNAYTVQVKANRNDIMTWLQEGRKDMKPRPAFGITKKDMDIILRQAEQGLMHISTLRKRAA